MKKVLFTLCIIVTGLLVLTGCEKREDQPSVLDVTPPPRPFNLEIVKTSTTIYTLTWQIDDPSTVVSEYRVYSINSFGPPDLLGTTDQLTAEIDTVVELGGLVFGVSAVTIENVESDVTSLAAPN